MSEDVLVFKGEGNVDVQIGGPGNPWAYLSPGATMSGPSIPLGGIERRWEQDPNKAGAFRVSSQFRTAPDLIGADLTTKLGKINKLTGLQCSFNLRARYAKCGTREDPSNYDPLMLAFCSVQLTDYSYDDLVIADPGNEDEIMVTSPWQANYEMRLEHMNPGRIGSSTEIGDQAINDIEYCDEANCGGYCGERTDGCAVIFAVTDADNSPYAAPSLIKGVKDLNTGTITWTVYPILGINGNVNGVECAGSRLLVASNADSAVAYNDAGGDQDEWNVVVLGKAPAARHSALFKRTAREIWVAAADGYVYKSVNGGVSFSAVHPGTLTSEDLNAVWAFNKNLAYAVGNNGTIIKTTDGGVTWVDLTETSTTSANLLKVIVPPGRAKEVYIGTNNGRIYRSKNEGSTFAALSFDGEGVGSVDDIDFCGPCAGDVMFILHNDAGPRGRILRDLSGGAGGPDVEIISDYTQVIGSGVGLNALACCGVNTVVAGGENFNSYPVILQGSAG